MTSLCTILPKMSAYRRDRDETNYIFFLIKNDELLEKYNSARASKEFYGEPVYDEKHLK